MQESKSEDAAYVDLPATKLAGKDVVTKDGTHVVIAQYPELDITVKAGATRWVPTSNGFKKEVDKKREHIKFHNHTAKVNDEQLKFLKDKRAYGSEWMSQDDWLKDQKEKKPNAKAFRRSVQRYYAQSLHGKGLPKDQAEQVDDLMEEIFG